MFAEDLAPFFDTTDGFASTATVGASSFPVVFDDDYTAPLGAFESSGPRCQAKSADVVANSVVQGSAININAVAYQVTQVQPDGTGVTTLLLERAA